SGTPAYMAPEQLLRGQTSVQSDIYSLGLTLYELLCGKPAHQAGSIADVRRFHESGSRPTPISEIVDGIGPAAERIVGKCLASDPLERPTSVRAVALALPGANPLLAAIDAGDVPSPELLAALETGTRTSRWFANLLLATLLASLVGIYFTSDRAYENNLADPTNPEVLTARAREIFDLLGYKNEVADWDRGYFAVKDEPLQTKDTASGSLRRWKSATSPAKPGIRFWYRESPHSLLQNEIFSGERGSFTFGQVSYGSPKWYAGMRGLQLSPEGFLRDLRCVSERTASTSTPSDQIDWSQLLPQSLTGLDLSLMKKESWRMPTHGPADYVQSWEGQYPDSDTKCYVQAAVYRGRLSEFHF
ncbi:MAG: protein kinase, partial [Planctomycetales bacterium]|nr:protein kinase [Planctomycetales bacterium]